jgi:hypothetical protein
MAKKHIATYPLYGSNPLSLRVDTRNRVGTGYIYSADEIPAIEQRLAKYGHPFRIRWRNDDCWRAALSQTKGRL